MYAFTYERPSATADAAKLVKAGGQALAGGQTMLAAVKQRLMQPEQLGDLGKIAEIKGIKKNGNNNVNGATVGHQQGGNNDDVQKHNPPPPARAAGRGGTNRGPKDLDPLAGKELDFPAPPKRVWEAIQAAQG